MVSYTIKRLLQLVIVLLAVTLMTFLMLKLVPGDPARFLAGKLAPPSRIAFVRHQFGLDRPVYVQYFKYVWSVAHGNLGSSLYADRPVAQMIWEAAPVSIQLAVAAILIELVGIPLGIYSALRQYTLVDTALTTAALIVWGIPSFVLAVFLQHLLGLRLNWLPIGGVGQTVLFVIPTSWHSFSTLILPALTIGVIEIAYISYMQRASMLEVIRTDYVRTARAKGLTERRVVFRHALKNALIPVMTIAGIDLGALMAGGVIVETIFNRPGLGLMLYTAVSERDPAVVAGCVLFGTFFFVFVNLLVDLAYAWIDPRIRLDD